MKIDLLGEVRSDNAVRDAVRRRQLLMETLPGSEAAKGILAIADRLRG
jgi:flagellar biosynthesis protein FlhG